MKTYSYVFLSIFLLFASVTEADDKSPSYNRISLSVTASQQVEQDVLVAVLFVQDQDIQSSKAADQVNKTMQWALELLTDKPEIKVRTLGYQTQPLYDKRKVTGWRVRQSLRLQSQDVNQMTSILSVLQQQLDIESFSYSLSKSRKTVVESELVNQAIAAFIARAEQVQLQFGRSGYQIVQMTLNSNQPRYRNHFQRSMRVQAEMASSKVAAPAIEAGAAEISMVATGTIELSAQ